MLELDAHKTELMVNRLSNTGKQLYLELFKEKLKEDDLFCSKVEVY
jgi:hypothetical protein